MATHEPYGLIDISESDRGQCSVPLDWLIYVNVLR